MRKLIAPAVVSALALLLSLQPGAGAQANPLTPQGPGGAELEAKARAFLQALQSLQADALFNQLAPWRQAAAGLARARYELAARNGELEWDGLEAEIKQLDPTGRLGVSSVQDFVALSPGRMLALHFGLYRMAGDSSDTSMLAEQWFAVHRAIGLTEPSRGWDQAHSKWTNVLETGGQVGFENVSGHQIQVSCVSDGREWHVIDAQLIQGGRARIAVSDALEALSTRSVTFVSAGSVVRAAEGEQLLGSHRNRMRVAYAKMGSMPARLTGEIAEGGSGVTKEELESKHYSVRDAVYSSGNIYGLAAEPKNPKDPWLLYYSDMFDVSVSHIFQFDSKAKLDDAVRAVERGERPADPEQRNTGSPK